VFVNKVIATALLVTLMGPSRVSADVDDIREILSRVNADSMMSTIDRLVAFDNRFMGSDSNWAAVAWLGERFSEMGYTVTLDSFQVNVNRLVLGHRYILTDLTQVNVVARREGLLSPEKKIVLGAHYDSISLDRDQDDQGFAPGADDNATGVAAVLEIARLLKDVQTGSTVEFVLFGAEELGLVGSDARAARALEESEDIILMMGLDVLGTRSEVFPDAFTLDTTSRGSSLAEQIADAAETFTDVFARDGSSNSRIMVTGTGCRCSDHQSYLDHGFPAIGVFQFFTNPAPHINTTTDTIENVDIGYAAAITQAVLAGTLEISGFPSLSPDFDGSGVVDFADFLSFAEVFGTDPVLPEDEVFDLDSDGAVGFSDFLIFAENFGRVF
jgi:leucyl aminopeptidase